MHADYKEDLTEQPLSTVIEVRARQPHEIGLCRDYQSWRH